jgi:predicted SnoaL-like aldol condensation-catalyzing enzyme
MTEKYQLTCLTANSSRTALTFLAFSFFFVYSVTLFGQSKKSKSTNKEVVQKWFDMVNNHDISEMNKIFAADYIWHTMDGKDIRSSQDSSHVVFLKSVLGANPTFRYEIVSIINEGDLVAVNTIVFGKTQSPSGEKNIKVKQMFFYRLSRGLITEEWEVLDTDLMAKQMGRICPD